MNAVSLGRILIVDDEPKLIHLVREILLATGYEVLAANRGEQAMGMVAVEQPDLILLDVQLLGAMDGYQVAERIREFSEVPIIMLTVKSSQSDLLRGFEAGVDDYITKPFNSKELLARLRAVLKRSQGSLPARVDKEIVCGHLRIDLLRRVVTIFDHEVHLTPTEYNLICELARHANQVLLHEQLLSAVWGPEYRDEVDYLRSYIHCLRKKLEPNPADPQMILSSPGVGYMLHVPELEEVSETSYAE
jgi:two-component system KDP operon response regulator KdpE